MKFRDGFVSNSSSSSFCLIGRRIPFSEFREMKGMDLPKNGLTIKTKYTNEGAICATVKDATFLKYMQIHPEDIEDIFEVFAESSDWDETVLSKEDIKKMSASKGAVVVHAFTIDQGSVDNLKDYLEYYKGDGNES